MVGDPKVDQRTRRIQWARGMTNDEIADLLQAKLMEARADKASVAPILLELVHEIKHRLSVTNYTPRAPEE
jgi:hypothetical protein